MSFLLFFRGRCNINLLSFSSFLRWKLRWLIWDLSLIFSLVQYMFYQFWFRHILHILLCCVFHIHVKYFMSVQFCLLIPCLANSTQFGLPRLSASFLYLKESSLLPPGCSFLTVRPRNSSKPVSWDNYRGHLSLFLRDHWTSYTVAQCLSCKFLVLFILFVYCSYFRWEGISSPSSFVLARSIKHILHFCHCLVGMPLSWTTALPLHCP